MYSNCMTQPKEIMGLVKEYFSLLTQYQKEYGVNTILLMQVGSFFEVYAIESDMKNIQLFSQLCDLNVVEKSNSKVFMAGFKDSQLERYLKKIQEAGCTAVVYAQDETKIHRKLAGIFSPGTYFSESTKLTNSITCIWIDVVEERVLRKGRYITIGISNIDIYTGKTTIFQCNEEYRNNPTTYDQLERFISITNPSEVILIANMDLSEMETVISYAGIQCDLIHKIQKNNSTYQQKLLNCEKQTYQQEMLSTYYKEVQSFYEYDIATQSFCFLLDFVYQHNPHLVNQLSEPEWENTNQRLSLANHSLKQLNMIHDGSVKPNKYSCVASLLNDCSTPMGKRHFNDLLLHPVYDETYLQKEYDMIDYMIHYTCCFKDLLLIKDLSKWERQVFLKKTTPRSFVQLVDNMKIIQQVYAKCDEPIRAYVGQSMIDVSCQELNAFIQQHIQVDMAKEIDTFDINFMKTGIDEELDQKSKLLLESEQKLNAIQRYFNMLIESKEKKKTEYVKYHETEKNNIDLLCTKRRCKLLQEALPKKPTVVTIYDNDQTFEYTISKQQITFCTQSASNLSLSETQLNDVCKNITALKTELRDIIARVFYSFVKKFEMFQSQLDNIITFVTRLDVIHTKASVAKKYNYCKPTIGTSSKSFVQAKMLRHALIEQFHRNEIYVANDVTLGEDTDGILLYGTNAVGKTSFIRSLGIAVIMAQAGMYVPCSSFHFKPYQCLFTRIIGNDNLFKGMSTFAVEMSELRTILKLSDEYSLILGDELCSGTETQSAISIFVAGIQHLHHRKSSFLFATHLHEITDYDEITSLSSVQMKHLSVIYNKEKDTLVYDRKLKDGPGENMYGLEVCKSLQLPADFIEAAYKIRMSRSNPSGLSLKSSRYNSHKLVGDCEKCGKKGTEVHHIHPQKDAQDGFIKTEASLFHKNHLGNLMTLCTKCHDKIHH
jgi:DNA mismatch repair protein MutS